MFSNLAKKFSLLSCDCHLVMIFLIKTLALPIQHVFFLLNIKSRRMITNMRISLVFLYLMCVILQNKKSWIIHFSWDPRGPKSSAINLLRFKYPEKKGCFQRGKTYTMVCDWNVTLVVYKYYTNRVSLSQDYTPSKCFYANFQ